MKQPFFLGLTGSIGMGKSATAQLFAKAGVAVWDADAVVHRLYAKGGAAVAPIAALWPAAMVDGAIDRSALHAIIAADPAALRMIEGIVHPLVAADRQAFRATVPPDLAVLDLPLLFETGADAEMDATLLVTAPPKLQAARVLARPGMTQEKFQRILSHQMPDGQKRARATHIIETLSPEAAKAAVSALIRYIRKAHDA